MPYRYLIGIDIISSHQLQVAAQAAQPCAIYAADPRQLLPGARRQRVSSRFAHSQWVTVYTDVRQVEMPSRLLVSSPETVWPAPMVLSAPNAPHCAAMMLITASTGSPACILRPPCRYGQHPRPVGSLIPSFYHQHCALPNVRRADCDQRDAADDLLAVPLLNPLDQPSGRGA